MMEDKREFDVGFDIDSDEVSITEREAEESRELLGGRAEAGMGIGTKSNFM